MMAPIKLGIVGCGVISKKHLKAAKACPEADVVAVADVQEDRGRSVAEEFAIPTYYDNEDDLLRDSRLDAVILALPTGVRTPIAFKALESGKHLLLEKPIASTAQEVEKMIDLRGDRVVGCCSSRHTFTGHAEAAKACVATGVLGDIRLVRIRAVHPAPAQPRDNPPPWRQSMELNAGGILVNWSSYDLDYVFHVTDWQLKPNTVLATWWPVGKNMSSNVAAGSNADSHYAAFVQCENNIALSMERAEFSSTRIDRAWEIIGTDASIHMPLQPPQDKPNAVILDKFVQGEGIVSETIWEEGQEEPQDDVLNNFVQAVYNDTQPRTNLERALVVQKITDAIYASAESGECQPVEN